MYLSIVLSVYMSFYLPSVLLLCLSFCHSLYLSFCCHRSFIRSVFLSFFHSFYFSVVLSFILYFNRSVICSIFLLFYHLFYFFNVLLFSLFIISIICFCISIIPHLFFYHIYHFIILCECCCLFHHSGCFSFNIICPFMNENLSFGLRAEKSTQSLMRWWSVSCVTLSPCSSTTTWSATIRAVVRAPVAVVTAATGPTWTAGSEVNVDQAAHTTSCALHAGKSTWPPTWGLWAPNRTGEDEETMNMM